ncbi:2'-5' RNA ligase family protein [Salegentibacter chungangensis]|uniref:2'-5' RNA ligase family protein n=1 Tax=Salegentibacter chungangensis TaxID=1335724 RepID=A0ABW3NSM7_9FLAO
MTSSTFGKSTSHLYFIALLPPAKIRKEIEAFKKELKESYRIKHALKLPAHITLQIPFRMQEKKEPVLIRNLLKFAKDKRSFQVSLSGFGKFSQNVIFVKVSEHRPVIDLFEDLQSNLAQILDLKNHEKAARIHPHITIASRDLKTEVFPEIWAVFKDRNYQSSFRADSIHLFRHNGKTWDILRKIDLH